MPPKRLWNQQKSDGDKAASGFLNFLESQAPAGAKAGQGRSNDRSRGRGRGRGGRGRGFVQESREDNRRQAGSGPYRNSKQNFGEDGVGKAAVRSKYDFTDIPPQAHIADIHSTTKLDISQSKYAQALRLDEPVEDHQVTSAGKFKALTAQEVSDLLQQVRNRKAQLAPPSTEMTSFNPYSATKEEEALAKSSLRSRHLRLKIDQPSVAIKLLGTEQQQQQQQQDHAAILKISASSVPEIEWWDQVAENSGEITSTIVHPVEIEPFWERFLPPDTPEYHTAKEARKIRCAERRARLKEAGDRVRLGLDPPPAPVIRPSNVAAVFGSKFYADPTRFENMAREAAEARHAKHEADNAARKLTGEQRWLKFAAKVDKQALVDGVAGALYRIRTFSDSKHRFIVNSLVEEGLLSGIAISEAAGYTMLVVEGVPREILKFSRALERRVRWTERRGTPHTSSHCSTISDEEYAQNECKLLWTGQVREKRFQRFSIHDVDHLGKQKLLSRFKLERHWNAMYEPKYEASDDILDLRIF